MILNWKTIATGFIVTLILYIAGASLGHISILKGIIYILAPIIGGFVAVYMNNTNYVGSIINGGIASGIAGFTATFIISWLIGPNLAFEGYLEIIIVIIVINAIMALLIGALLGLIGGILGLLAKRHVFENENLT
ncbi:DUF5518 domain-containing protein [Methanobacterium sp.]|uniref:DUF5518 domain-containing protein n=1 Tax=Methanobacterium sp. TaxID=2164 RepID=UPI003C714BCB